MDSCWWRVHGDEARAKFEGQLLAPRAFYPYLTVAGIDAGNSGAGAIRLAHHLGAEEIVLLGFDCKHAADGKTHWHGSHPVGLADAGMVQAWPTHFADAARLIGDCKVTNCTPDSALDTFPRGDLRKSLGIIDLVLNGMHGMGDCLHQRAVIRELNRKLIRVFLTTPWPEMYHDLAGQMLILKEPQNATLRTQKKNLARADKSVFDTATQPDKTAPRIDVRYPPDTVRLHRGVLAAMAAQCWAQGAFDFSLPIADTWRHGLDLPDDRPVLVYRPLVTRREWTGCEARNPNADAYRAVFEAVRARLNAFVVSVADIDGTAETLASRDIGADLTLHKGELHFTQLCALWRRADLVYTAPGFALIMAQAVSTPVITLFGGYERAYSFRDDLLTCKIEPDNPCDCFTHNHGCGKRIDTSRAVREALQFVETHFPTGDCDGTDA